MFNKRNNDTVISSLHSAGLSQPFSPVLVLLGAELDPVRSAAETSRGNEEEEQTLKSTAEWGPTKASRQALTCLVVSPPPIVCFLHLNHSTEHETFSIFISAGTSFPPLTTIPEAPLLLPTPLKIQRLKKYAFLATLLFTTEVLFCYKMKKKKETNKQRFFGGIHNVAQL